MNDWLGWLIGGGGFLVALVSLIWRHRSPKTVSAQVAAVEQKAAQAEEKRTEIIEQQVQADAATGQGHEALQETWGTLARKK